MSTSETLIDDILAAMRDVHGSLPSGLADLSVRTDPDGSKTITLTPTNSRAATISVFVAKWTPNVMVWVGQSMPLEFTTDRRRTERETVRQTCLSVIDKGADEEVCYAGNEIVRSVGHYWAGGRRRKVYRLAGMGKADRTVIYHYAPYRSVG